VLVVDIPDQIEEPWYRGQVYVGYKDAAKNSPQCVIITGTGRKQQPPMHSIYADHPFQIVSIDIMELL